MRLLVIGGVAAGLSAAARARRIDPGLEIVVLEKGAAISYGACGLPYYLEGRVRRAEQLIVYTPEYFRKERNITVRTGARVVSISHPRREVAIDVGGGERVHYDRLVIATGARPRTPDAAIAALPQSFVLHTLEDAGTPENIPARKAARSARGDRRGIYRPGGRGRPAAQRSRGHRRRAEPTRAEPRRRRANQGAVRERLERFRVELRLNEGAHAGPRAYDLVDPGNRPAAQRRNRRPKPAWNWDAPARSAWTSIWKRICQASTRRAIAPKALHLVTGRPAYIPLGTTANKMGRVAGANAAGRRERFGGSRGHGHRQHLRPGSGVQRPFRRHRRAAKDSLRSPRALPPHSRAGYFGGKPHHGGTGGGLPARTACWADRCGARMASRDAST